MLYLLLPSNKNQSWNCVSDFDGCDPCPFFSADHTPVFHVSQGGDVLAIGCSASSNVCVCKVTSYGVDIIESEVRGGDGGGEFGGGERERER